MKKTKTDFLGVYDDLEFDATTRVGCGHILTISFFNNGCPVLLNKTLLLNTGATFTISQPAGFVDSTIYNLLFKPTNDEPKKELILVTQYTTDL